MTDPKATPRTDAVFVEGKEGGAEVLTVALDAARELCREMEREVERLRLSISDSPNLEKALMEDMDRMREKIHFMGDTLKRIKAWDVMNPPTDDGSDARFWRSEIDKALSFVPAEYRGNRLGACKHGKPLTMFDAGCTSADCPECAKECLAVGNPYWLIERGSPAEWWVRGMPEEWTRDSAVAQRFNEWGARKHAAELEAWGVTGPLRVTEHVDCAGPDPLPSQDSKSDTARLDYLQATKRTTYRYGYPPPASQWGITGSAGPGNEDIRVAIDNCMAAHKAYQPSFPAQGLPSDGKLT